MVISKPISEITHDDIIALKIGGERQAADFIVRVLRPRWLARERAKTKREIAQ